MKFKVPRSVQDAIPIRRIWPDGIFQVGNQYSKSWSFTDINYAIADKDDKIAMFLDYCALLNALDSGASGQNHDPQPPHRQGGFRTVGAAAAARRRPRPLPRGIQRDAARPGHRHQQQHGAGAVFDRQHRQAEHRRGPHLLRPRRHRPGHAISPSSARWRRSCPRQTVSACCGISSRPVSRPPLTSICASTPSAATASRTGSAPTAWSSPPTTSRSTAASGGCCICRIMPATSKIASSRNSVTSTAA